MVPWFDFANLSRSILVCAFRLRSGHIPVNKFYCLMRKKPSPLCKTCGVNDDLMHFLLKCSLNNGLRVSNFRDGLYGGEVNCVLSDPVSTAAIALFQFCNSSFRLRQTDGQTY